MSRLILVKHSLPEIDPMVPASAWRLSDEGRRRCAGLADRLARFGPTRIVASDEPKATETGHLVAVRLGLPFATASGLHEHDRTGVPFLPADAFASRIEDLFRRPTALILGRESASEAAARFGAALDAVLGAHPAETVAVVAHGTVIALWVAARTGCDGLALWRRLDLPAMVVVSPPDGVTVEVIERAWEAQTG